MSFSDKLVPTPKRKSEPGSFRTAFFAGGNAETASDVDQNILFQDPSGRVRFEVPDNDARLRITSQQQWEDGEVRTLSQILDHPKLYEAYPDLASMPVAMLPGLNDGIYGAYSPEAGEGFQDYFPFMNDPEAAESTMSASPTGAMVLNPTFMMYEPEALQQGQFVRQSDQAFLDMLLHTLLHEGQHAIDEREGIAYDWSTDYDRRPSEAIAEMVPSRRTLTDEERYDDVHSLGDSMLGIAQWDKPIESRGIFSSMMGYGRLTPAEMHKLMLEQSK